VLQGEGIEGYPEKLKGRGFHSVSTPLSGALIGEFRKLLISLMLS
jgi:hypothetical protein